MSAIAEAHGARLSIQGNGEFWEFAREEGDALDVAVLEGACACGRGVDPPLERRREEILDAVCAEDE